MSATVNSLVATIVSHVTPREAFALGEAGYGPLVRPRVNAHCHLPPNFSAFTSIRQALELADAQDVRVLGASNYYDYSVYDSFAAEACLYGIFPLFGLEIICLIDSLVQSGVKVNDPGNPGKMYICGKGITGFDPMSHRAYDLLQTIRDNDSARMTAVAAKLAAVFRAAGVETNLDSEAVKSMVVKRHFCQRDTVYLQERHLAQAFQVVLFDKVPEPARPALFEKAFGCPLKSKPGDGVGIQNEIRSQLMKAGKPAFVPDTFVDFAHAFELILALRGIPCYPCLVDGASPITEYEASPAKLIADLKDRGIHAAEFIPARNSPANLSTYVHALRDAGLFVTAGTEHNTLDLIPIEPTCLGGESVPDDLQDIFWEGACVVAAHQFLTLHGLPGYVSDSDGRPNAKYGTANERIEAFRKIGAAVIGKFQEATAEQTA